MKSSMISDSPNWLSPNSSNICCLQSNYLSFASHKKIVFCDLRTGYCEKILTLGKDLYAICISCNSENIAVCCSDNYLRFYNLHTLQEIKKTLIGKCQGIKYWGNDIVYIVDNKYKLLRENEIIEEWALDDFLALETCGEYLGIADKTKVQIKRFLYVYEIKGSWNCIALDHYKSLQIVLVNCEFAVAIRGEEEIVRIPLKRSNNKGKNSVFSAAWVDENRFAYSTGSGEIIIVQITPKTSQSFMNNPHNRAILAMVKSGFGVISLGMDRILCCWHISNVETPQTCPRSYTTAFAYTEPIWDYQALEGSVYSMALYSEKLIVTCGKQSLLLFDLASPNLHGRCLYKTLPGNAIAIDLYPETDLLSVNCTNEILIISCNQEKILGQHKMVCTKTAWKTSSQLYLSTKNEVFLWNYTSKTCEKTITLDFEISLLWAKDDILILGTQEGNLLYCKDLNRIYISVYHNQPISCISLGPSLAVGSEDGTISLHAIPNSKSLFFSYKPLLLLEKHHRPVLSLLWSYPYIISSSLDHTVQVWDSNTGNPINSIRLHTGAVRHILVHPLKPNIIISGSDDQTIRFTNALNSCNNLNPPKVQNCKKPEPIKSLFPNLHKFIYQQNKEDAIISIKSLLENNENLENELFYINQEKALEILKSSMNNEAMIWVKVKKWIDNDNHKGDEDENIDGLGELSFLYGGKILEDYAKIKAQEEMMRRKVHKSIVWILISKDIRLAVEVYLGQKMFIEALVIAGIFGGDKELVYRKWAERLEKTNKGEQAVKCWIGIKEYGEVLRIVDGLQQNGSLKEIREILIQKMMT